MRFGKFMCGLMCAASVVSTPVMAESLSPTARISASSKVKRVAPAVKKESKFGGDNSIIIYVLAAAAVIGGIILLTDDDPASP